MDKKVILGDIGSIIKYLGMFMIFPIGVAVWYGEENVSHLFFIIKTWVVPLAITISVGVVLEREVGVRKGEIKRREGFVIVSLGWLFACG